MYDPLNIYRGKYKEFIDDIIEERPLNEKLEYSEYHHVIPFCCEGKDNDEENIRVYLTYREHFIAHKILAEDNPTNSSLVYAYWRMCNGKMKVASSEEYESGKRLFRRVGPPNKGKSPSNETREKLSRALKGREITQSHRDKIRYSLKGIPHTDERKAKISGENHPMYGKKHSEETKKRMSENHVDNSGENHPMYGRHLSEETKKKISTALTGHKFTEESKRKMSEAQRGNKNNLGNHHSEETKKKISESRKRYYEQKRKGGY